MPEALRLLSDETRWRLIGELRWSDRQVGELCERLDLPQNLVSYHLGILRQARLVSTHRSDADGRVLYYALDLAALQQQWQSVGSALALDIPLHQRSSSVRCCSSAPTTARAHRLPKRGCGT